MPIQRSTQLQISHGASGLTGQPGLDVSVTTVVSMVLEDSIPRLHCAKSRKLQCSRFADAVRCMWFG